MLCLSRKSDQSIIIGDNIRITVTKVGGDVVRFGIEAPKEVSIVREELLETAEPEAMNAD